MISPLLALIVPAFKPAFLDAALSSIAAQTTQSFRVYVFDDASPSDLGSICGRFSDRLNIRYHRFSENLGGRDLVAHWNRCVALSSAPWVWLFSDDDVMDSRCIERLLQVIAAEGDRHNVFHFNVTKIDGSGQVLEQLPDFPSVLSGRQFAHAKLRFDLSSFAPDFVFSRAAFDRLGGFVNFPLAWCSDDASWVAMAGETGIRTIDGPRVYWRLSGQNISSKSPEHRSRMLEALVAYLQWLDAYLAQGVTMGDGDLTVSALRAEMPRWLFKQIAYMGMRLTPSQAWAVGAQLHGCAGQPWWFWLPRMLKRAF